MKVVQIGQTKYEIRSKDDVVSLTHQLARQGYSITEIADILGVTEKTVMRYLQECW